MGTITLKAHNAKTLPDEEHGYLSFEEYITFPTCKEVHEMLIYHTTIIRVWTPEHFLVRIQILKHLEAEL